MSMSWIIRSSTTPTVTRGENGLTRVAEMCTGRSSSPSSSSAFTIARARPDLNRWQSAVYMQQLPQSGQPITPAIQLTFPERGPKQEGQDFAPRLSPDGQRLAFLSTRDGAGPQLYLMTVGGGEARKLTSLPGGVASLLWTPDSRALIIQARVVEGCPPYPAGEECNRHRSEAMEKNPVRARLIDRLMYRHWDDWYDGRRSHLVRVALPDGALPAGVSAIAGPAAAPVAGAASAGRLTITSPLSAWALASSRLIVSSAPVKTTILPATSLSLVSTT